jgi:hypothetical protein
MAMINPPKIDLSTCEPGDRVKLRDGRRGKFPLSIVRSVIKKSTQRKPRLSHIKIVKNSLLRRHKGGHYVADN